MAKEPREDGVSAPPKRREVQLRTGSGDEVVDYICEVRADGSMRLEATDEADHARMMAALKEAKEMPGWLASPPPSASPDVEGLAGAMEKLGASLAQSLSVQATATSAPAGATVPSRPRAIGLAADQWLKSIQTETLRKTLTIKSAAIMGFARHVGMKKLFHEVQREDVHAWVRVIEKVLGVLVRLAEQLSDHQAERDRREAAAFMHEDQHRERRAIRQSARQRLAQWEASHPWRLRTATVMGEPTEWQRLQREVKRRDEQTHEAQTAARRVRSQIATFDQEGHQLRGDQREQLGRLGGALDSVREARADWVLALRNAATTEEQDWIKTARPVLVREDWKTADPALRQPALVHRPRVGRVA